MKESKINSVGKATRMKVGVIDIVAELYFAAHCKIKVDKHLMYSSSHKDIEQEDITIKSITMCSSHLAKDLFLYFHLVYS